MQAWFTLPALGTPSGYSLQRFALKAAAGRAMTGVKLDWLTLLQFTWNCQIASSSPGNPRFLFRDSTKYAPALAGGKIVPSRSAGSIMNWGGFGPVCGSVTNWVTICAGWLGRPASITLRSKAATITPVADMILLALEFM